MMNKTNKILTLNGLLLICATASLLASHVSISAIHHGSAPQTADVPETDTHLLQPEEMAEYCEGVAAEKYTQQPGNIITEPAEITADQYLVYGEYGDDEGEADITTFRCGFSKEGSLRFIEKNL